MASRCSVGGLGGRRIWRVGVSRVADAGVDVAAGFEVGYLTSAGDQVRLPLADAWGLRFEDVVAVRRFAAYRGQRHLSGRWWSATLARHVGYESWLERDHVMALDFDPAVVGIASQPFWLSWPVDDWRGRSQSHAPDYFVRLGDGSGVVIDCRPERRRRPRDLVAFEMTRQACELVGWQYRLVGGLDPVVTANLRWLAGYRHPRHFLEPVVARLRAVFAEPVALMDGAQIAGDPIAVLPVLFHLMWRHELVTDLSVPLRRDTPVVRVS